jgi:flagellar secretion chaperone FliS
MHPNAAASYRKTNVITADPKRLVIMLYEGAIDSIKLAKIKLIAKDFESKNKALVKAQNIISELLCSLDFEKGGQIAKNLDGLYNYMLRQILQADLNSDTERFDEIIGLLEELLSAWKTIFSNPNHTVESQTARFVSNSAPAPTDRLAV